MKASSSHLDHPLLSTKPQPWLLLGLFGLTLLTGGLALRELSVLSAPASTVSLDWSENLTPHLSPAAAHLHYLDYQANSQNPADFQVVDQAGIHYQNTYQIFNDSSLLIDPSALNQLDQQITSYLQEYFPDLVAPNQLPAKSVSLYLSRHNYIDVNNFDTSNSTPLPADQVLESPLFYSHPSSDFANSELIKAFNFQNQVVIAAGEPINHWFEPRLDKSAFDQNQGTGRELLHLILVHELLHLRLNPQAFVDAESHEKFVHGLDHQLTNLFQPDIFRLPGLENLI